MNLQQLKIGVLKDIKDYIDAVKAFQVTEDNKANSDNLYERIEKSVRDRFLEYEKSLELAKKPNKIILG